jgi:hypothetical protein
MARCAPTKSEQLPLVGVRDAHPLGRVRMQSRASLSSMRSTHIETVSVGARVGQGGGGTGLGGLGASAPSAWLGADGKQMWTERQWNAAIVRPIPAHLLHAMSKARRASLSVGRQSSSGASGARISSGRL